MQVVPQKPEARTKKLTLFNSYKRREVRVKKRGKERREAKLQEDGKDKNTPQSSPRQGHHSGSLSVWLPVSLLICQGCNYSDSRWCHLPLDSYSGSPDQGLTLCLFIQVLKQCGNLAWVGSAYGRESYSCSELQLGLQPAWEPTKGGSCTVGSRRQVTPLERKRQLRRSEEKQEV